MKRILIVGTTVQNFPSVGWDEWAASNPLDYQGLVLDCRKPLGMGIQQTIGQTLQILTANNHAAYILLPNAETVAAARGQGMVFVPNFHLFAQEAVGKTLRMQGNDPLFVNYLPVLDGHEICFQLHPMANRQTGQVIHGIIDNVSRTICAKTQGIYLLHPPPRNAEQKALRIVLEHFGPDPAPISSQAKPSWVDLAALSIPGVAGIQTARAAVAAEIIQKQAQLEFEEERLAGLTGWADLLWLEGLGLQKKVGEAFGLFGLEFQKDDPCGHSSDLLAIEENTEFVFEVAGTVGTTGIEKGRQLMQWVADRPNPARAKGVLVANAFRNDPPEKRPPTPDRRIFVSEVESLASRIHLALLDARELYRVVCIHLSGKQVPKSVIIDGLLQDGIVRFQIE